MDGDFIVPPTAFVVGRVACVPGETHVLLVGLALGGHPKQEQNMKLSNKNNKRFGAKIGIHSKSTVFG